ncbi:MAG: hypothetical protein APF80_07570 [Alphaproteobacteria bacterium BRH_c36]|nr:MAG: hypothetical protein APF80_07570 [Alphaproteobacteria bacterium BRH_c36]
MKESSDPGSFLERWSRRKRGVDSEPETESVGATGDAAEAVSNDAAGEGDVSSKPVAEKNFADFDFDKLDYDSDYKQFMEKDVSSEARHKALRKLWVSNPVLANMDGLDDYCEDYTDAAVCMPKGTMKTLYQYGRGFLDDDEVAEWESLGQESKEIAAVEAEERRLASEAATEADGEVPATEPDVAELDVAGQDTFPDSGPGGGCAAAVKADEAELLTEYEAEQPAGSKPS